MCDELYDPMVSLQETLRNMSTGPETRFAGCQLCAYLGQAFPALGCARVPKVWARYDFTNHEGPYLVSSYTCARAIFLCWALLEFGT